MNPMQILAMIKGGANPMMMLSQMAQQNPVMGRAMEMGKGKNEIQMQQTVRNLGKQCGMSDEELNQFVEQFGLKLQ